MTKELLEHRGLEDGEELPFVDVEHPARRGDRQHQPLRGGDLGIPGTGACRLGVVHEAEPSFVATSLRKLDLGPILHDQMIPCNGPPRRPEAIDPPLDLRVLHQRRGVVRLDPGVDHERAGAAPVLLVDERRRCRRCRRRGSSG